MKEPAGNVRVQTLLAIFVTLVFAATASAQLSQEPRDPQVLLENGARLLKQGHLDSAQAALRQAAALAPENAMIHLYLGRALMAEQKYGDAAPEFSEALRLDAAKPALGLQNRREAQDNLGLAYAFTRNYAAARKVYEAALKKDPDYPSFSYNLACVCALSGNRKGALIALKEAEDADSRSSLGRTLPDPTADTDLKGLWGDPVFQAILVMDQGPQPNDGPGSDLMREGARFLVSGDYESAVAKEKAATQKEPESARAWYFLGAALDSAGHGVEAADAFTHAIGLNVPPHNLLSKPMIRYAATQAGLALLAAQKNGEAVKAFLRAGDASPYHPTAYYDLARAYAALGEKTKAGEALKKAFSLKDNLLAVDPPLPDPAGDPAFSAWKKDEAWKATLAEVAAEGQGD